VHLSKQILDYRKKQTGTLRISENVTFANDDVMNYVIGALQKKLPWAPLPFNPALVDSKTQEIGLQSVLCTVGHFNLYIFFSEARKSTNPKVIWSRCSVKRLRDQNINSNITETHMLRSIKRITKKHTQEMKAIPHEI